jgi:uncharacterized membrane protein
MDAVLLEWGSLFIRWLHIIAGIAWIGSSFYFMHIDASLKESPEIPKGKGGDAWEVHGGGFYQVKKYLVAPQTLPKTLIWHKWESYTTWLSGFFLMVCIYYLSSELYLIDPSVRQLTPYSAAAIGIGGLALGWVVYDFLCKSPLGRSELVLAAVGFAFIISMAWFFQQMFSGRGALIHTGALMATIMSGNVFINIIPNQKKVIADLLAGKEPNPEYGKQAKTRSTHNNYLTLPVLFLMLSNHHPLTYTSPYAWLMVGFVLVAGALIRHFYNQRHAGHGDRWWTWGVAGACLAAVVAISLLSSPVGRQALGLKPAKSGHVASAVIASETVVPKSVSEIILTRCVMCHAGEPVWSGIATAPRGVLLETDGQIDRQATAIRIQAVMTKAMPPNNITEMTLGERQQLAVWLATR